MPVSEVRLFKVLEELCPHFLQTLTKIVSGVFRVGRQNSVQEDGRDGSDS